MISLRVSLIHLFWYLHEHICNKWIKHSLPKMKHLMFHHYISCFLVLTFLLLVSLYWFTQKLKEKKNKEGLIPSLYWSYIQYPNKPSWFCFKIYILFSSYSLFSDLAVTFSVKVISISQLRQWKISHSWFPYFHSFPYCSFSHNSQRIFSVYLNQIMLLTWWDLGILTILSRLPPMAQETVMFCSWLTFPAQFYLSGCPSHP